MATDQSHRFLHSYLTLKRPLGRFSVPVFQNIAPDCTLFGDMPLNREDVTHLAELARLDLDEDETMATERDLDKILGYVDRLKQVETRGVEPFTMPARDEWRPDVALPCDHAACEIILSNFPERTGDLLKTPGVFESPKGKK